MSRKTGYQVSDGRGGWLDIAYINDPDTLRKHLMAAMDALEEIDVKQNSLEQAIKKWRAGG